MTKPVEKAIEAARTSPKDLRGTPSAASQPAMDVRATRPQHRRPPEQSQELQRTLAEADRGEDATDREIAETWTKFGL